MLHILTDPAPFSSRILKLASQLHNASCTPHAPISSSDYSPIHLTPSDLPVSHPPDRANSIKRRRRGELPANARVHIAAPRAATRIAEHTAPGARDAGAQRGRRRARRPASRRGPLRRVQQHHAALRRRELRLALVIVPTHRPAALRTQYPYPYQVYTRYSIPAPRTRNPFVRAIYWQDQRS